MSKCTCFDDLIDEVKADIMARIPADASLLRVEWEGMLYGYEVKGRAPTNPRINIVYRKMKLDGTPFKNPTRETVTVFSSYCPFCGRKLGKIEGAAA
ncbi:hypothetical protein [Shewanella algae]|jgi:hypothetical protein|uniref:hypothetical protein n=1 Tax=Shewanella algae TaxID=38313 RepID=UPI00272869FD|nr:hypothetical protein [Shewanella algae]MDO8254835.1 hypothetical protein [Shewanella algae]